MAKRFRAGVLFCGGCNCYFDRERLYKNIKSKLDDICEFILCKPESEEKYDLIVLINGCQSECLMSAPYTSEMLLINNKNYKNSEELIRNKLIHK